MTIDIWWAIAALGIGIVLGVFFCLTVAPLLLHERPMDGRTYTGDLGQLDDDNTFDQITRDLDQEGRDIA